MNNRGQEIQSLDVAPEDELQELRLANDILRQKADHHQLIGSTSEQVLFADREEDVIKTILETSSSISNISYSSYLSPSNKGIVVADEFAINAQYPLKGEFFNPKDGFMQIISGEKHLCEIRDENSSPPFIPQLTCCSVPNSYYIYPILIQNRPVGWLCFVNCLLDISYLKNHVGLLDRLGEIASARIESIRHREEIDKLNKSLNKTKERYELAQQAAQIGSWDWDLEKDRILWSCHVESILGINGNNFDGTYKGFADLIHPDDRQHVIDSANKSIKEDSIFEIKHRIILPGRDTIWVRELGRAYRNKEGKAVRIAGIVKNITKQKRIEEALKSQNLELAEKENTFRTLVHSISGYLYSIRYQKDGTNSVYHSPQCKDITGFTPEEYRADPNLWINMVHPKDRSLVSSYFENLQKIRSDHPLQHRIIHKDGSTIWVLNRCSLTFNENGHIERADGLIVDISEQKKAEESLRESENNFRAIFDNAVDGIAIADAETMQLLLVNRMFCDMTGYKENELTNMSLLDLQQESAASAAFLPLTRGTICEKSIIRNMALKKKSGSTFFCEINASTHSISDRECLLGIFRDITDRRYTEDLIRQTLAERNSILEATLVGIIFMQKNNIVWMNSNVEEITGYSKEELLDQTGEYLYPSRSEYVSMKKASTPLLQKRLLYQEERLLKRKDKSLFWCHIMGKKMESDEYVDGSIWILEDITKRKAAEESLQKAKEEAEEATRVKDKFVNLVSHDLKGPITLVIGYLQMLKEDSFDPEMRNSMIDETIEACDDMTSLISEILNLSRLKGGEMKPASSFVNARHIVDYAIAGYSALAKDKEISLTNEIPQEKRIFADEKLMVESIRNLISNSIKFCRNEDSIRIFITDDDPSTIVLSDTGVGIEEERFDKLFRYEEKTSTRGTEGERGTGFGLPLVKEIIEAHGGEVRMESVIGKGSSFFLSLPDVKPRIMIVDDDEDARYLIKSLLEGLDLSLLEADSVNYAIEMLEKQAPHLIFLDLIMPEDNGVKLLEHMKKKNLDIPVVVITVDNKVETADRVFELGAEDFIVKPFKREGLVATVKRYVG